ncbi:MAG TPA: HAD family phosphatase [Bacteroidetes bacterium]|nr:HAD family phosphatase [Bacteroidota bacterium]
MAIQNLIFDLGGVLYAIDIQRTFDRLWALVPPTETRPVPKDFSNVADHEIFRAFEKGDLSAPDFREALRHRFGLVGSDAAIDAAWNALLLGVIPGRIATLKQLSAHYRLILLSNTNSIHKQHYAAEVAPLFACFEQIFLSFEMGLRKPDASIYTTILNECGINAAQSLFIDDTQANLNGAAALGIQTFLIGNEAGSKFTDLLQKLNTSN